MGKLNFEAFPEDEQNWIRDFQHLLAELRSENLEKHLALCVSAPHSATEDDIYLQEPCIYSLAAYGSAGIEALHALGERESRASFDAQRALIQVAVGDANAFISVIDRSELYLDEEPRNLLRSVVQQTVADEAVRALARRLLAGLIRLIVTEPRRRHEITTMIGGFGKGEDLVWDLLAKSVLNINDADLAEFQRLVDQDLDESVYQKFLEAHPAILDPVASSIVPTQPLGEMFATDFVIRRLDNEYIFVEIEKARDRMFTEYPQPSAALSHALAQVLSWFTWVEDNIAYAQSHGYPGIHAPKGLIVIGRVATLNTAQSRMLRQLNDLLYPRISIRTYDEVVSAARNVLYNLTVR